MFQDLSRRLIETGFGGFEKRPKFIKFGLWLIWIITKKCSYKLNFTFYVYLVLTLTVE